MNSGHSSQTCAEPSSAQKENSQQWVVNKKVKLCEDLTIHGLAQELELEDSSSLTYQEQVLIRREKFKPEQVLTLPNEMQLIIIEYLKPDPESFKKDLDEKYGNYNYQFNTSKRDWFRGNNLVGSEKIAYVNEYRHLTDLLKDECVYNFIKNRTLSNDPDSQLCSIQDKKGDTILHVAAQHHHGFLVFWIAFMTGSKFLDIKNKLGNTPLHCAADDQDSYISKI